MSRILISATHKSSGKTTITLGLCAALKAQGLVIQSFKKGPDYIDPLWLSQASGRPCHNLDFQIMDHAELISTFIEQSQGVDLNIIEGNLALFDGIDVEGHNSNAALAQLLQTPVILVLDTQGMTRSVVPIILGYQAFEPNIKITGVILNLVASPRHEDKLRTAIHYYTDVAIVGAVPYDTQLTIEQRHLGLIPSHEDKQAETKIAFIAQKMTEFIDSTKLLQLAKAATTLSSPPSPPLSTSTENPTFEVTIGIIRDVAFGFYYPGDLIALEQAGAKLIFIDALHDTRLPPVDALFIGGGFPETQMTALAHNRSLKHDIYQFIENNMPVYAECGGLMYLSRRLTWQDQTCEMVGALPFDTLMETRPQGHGYLHLQETGHGLWPLRDTIGQLTTFYAHEFHYSKVINLPTHLKFAYQVLRGTGLDGQHDGIVYKNTLACYAHLRDVKSNRWTQRFVAFVHRYKHRINAV